MEGSPALLGRDKGQVARGMGPAPCRLTTHTGPSSLPTGRPHPRVRLGCARGVSGPRIAKDAAGGRDAGPQAGSCPLGAAAVRQQWAGDEGRAPAPVPPASR